MPIITNVIAQYVAEQILQEAFKDTVYSCIKDFFFPKKSFKKQLEETIVAVVIKYREEHPNPTGKVAFYEKEEVFSYLSTYTYYGKGESQHFKDLLQKYPELDVPTVCQLEEFFGYFFKMIKENSKLRKLFVEENYQVRIFELGKQLNAIEKKVDRILDIMDHSHILDIPFYVERNIEQELLAKIEKESVLLLTGMSFCGKTQLARFLCKEYQDKDYIFIEDNDINVCVDKLKRAGSKPTIFLLDDPFGHIYDNNDSQNNWTKLNDFLRNFPKKHKLIVCSRTDLIYQINSNQGLVDCNIWGYSWIDLTVSDRDFIIRYWNEAALLKSLDKNFIDNFSTYLFDNFNQELLQPGQLDFLLHKSYQELKDKPISELIHLAKADSKNIANVILHDSSLTEIYIALGFSCSTINFVSYQELAYILSYADTMIGYSKVDEDTLYHSDLNKEDPILPIYSVDLKLEDHILRGLTQLQISGYIQILKEKIRFRHPTYQSVSKFLIHRENVHVEDLIKKILPRSFSTLSSANALVSLRQSMFLYRNMDLHREFLREQFLTAINSTLFPVVKDRFVSDILNILTDFTSEEKDRILRTIQSGVSTSTIFWSDDTPFYDKENWNFWSTNEDTKEDLNLNERISRVNEGKAINTKELWELVEAIDIQIFLTITEKGIQSILNCDEIFIRAIAVNKIFKYGMPTFTIVDQIFSDSHPAVIIEAIKGAFDGYKNYETEQRMIILEKLKYAMREPIINLRGENFFCNFGLDYTSETLDFDSLSANELALLWRLWGELFPVFLDNFPKDRGIMNSARFSKNLFDSFKFLSEVQRLKIAASLFNWIDIRLRLDMRLDTYMLDVISCLFEDLTIFSESRKDLLQRCLSHWHTGFAASSLSLVIFYWESLSIEETGIVLDSLDQNRLDVRWLKAIAITGHEIPSVIQHKLLGNASFFDFKLDDLINQMPDLLLSDALKVSIGRSWPLSSWGVGNANREVWQKIKEHIIIHKVEPHFSVCLPEMLTKFVNSGEHSSGYSVNIEKIWSDLCVNSNNKIRLLNFLIDAAIESNYAVNYTKILFDSLLNAFGENANTAYLLIAHYAEGMQSHDSSGTDFFCIMRSHLKKLLLEEPFITDRKIINLFLELKNPKSKVVFELTDRVNDIVVNSRVKPIKFRYCVSLIQEMIKKFPIYSKTLSKLQFVYYLGADVGKQQRRHLRTNHIIDDWNHNFNGGIYS